MIVAPGTNVTLGGAGTAVAQLLAAEAQPLPLLQIGIPDRFIEHGSRESCLAAAGLDLAGLSTRIEHWWASHCERDASAWRAELRSSDHHAKLQKRRASNQAANERSGSAR
jgi:hypothetical protein